jgi:sigma-B regulation protein RsbU (phosphoserine phosphatase)
MWVGVLDRGARTLTYVDAGHGYWTMRPEGGSTIDPKAAGIPLGIDETFVYRVNTIPLPEGHRILLFSDGIVEQRNAEGEQFGRGRLEAILAQSSNATDDASRVFDALLEFARTPSLDDDATIAGVEWT